MTRTLLLAAALGLSLTSAAGAMNAIPNVPSLWPAEGAFATPRKAPDIVTRALTTPTQAPATGSTRQDR